VGPEPGTRPGWIGFDLSYGFRKPTKVSTTLRCKALGELQGGKSCFSVGTRLGTALVVDGRRGTRLNWAISDLSKATFEDYSASASGRLGRRIWRRGRRDRWTDGCASIRTTVVLAAETPKARDLPANSRAGAPIRMRWSEARLWDSGHQALPVAEIIGLR